MTKHVSIGFPAARLAAGRISRGSDSQLTTTVCQCRSGEMCLNSSGMFMPPKKCTFKGRPFWGPSATQQLVAIWLQTDLICLVEPHWPALEYLVALGVLYVYFILALCWMEAMIAWPINTDVKRIQGAIQLIDAYVLNGTSPVLTVLPHLL